ncbi:predicted protein [Plenodomus lingam JN3]|uniref:Predicted protein n=1 Tax=Leptosphaeria maculans (strain JN3 / isolate v23.1.3 / race Av1-4-5-6-7-8) TaxID=985895 RepID=E4ZMY4_LEPMJ|nr:predicted protein [Plenodomus lingam JN3]CBX92587.1 predicted protein [Plenodomus lingam JN3]
MRKTPSKKNTQVCKKVENMYFRSAPIPAHSPAP